MVTSRLLCGVAVICAGAALTPALAHGADGHVLVAFGATVGDPAAIEAGAGGYMVGEIPSIAVRMLRAPDPRATAARLARRADVRYAEVDATARATAVPDDPLFTDQWGLRNGDLATADIEAD